MASDPNVVAGPAKVAARLFNILARDREERLLVIDAYLQGNHPEPYMPDTADEEYRLLAKRCITNWTPTLVRTPGQNLYVDGFRRGAITVRTNDRYAKDRLALPEWQHWQDSRLDARQHSVTDAALGYGHSFTVTERQDNGKIITRGLSPLRTAALWEDPANDDNPVAVLFVDRWPRSGEGDKQEPGAALMWDRTNKYWFDFKRGDDGWVFHLKDKKPHGTPGENPVTRFAPYVDLEGRTTGVVEPYLRVQDRINQTVFDLLVAQTGSSFETRWATGMAPPVKRDPETNEPVLDADGNPIPLPVNIHAKKMLFAEEPDARFGSLPATPLSPYVEAIDMAIRHLAALSQTPPHHLLGQVANLSAEALRAAEVALGRMVQQFRASFGESWERVFRIALLLQGDAHGEATDGEVIWRDTETHSLSETADGLSKLVEGLGVPKRAAWKRIPNITEGELAEMEVLAEEEASLPLNLRPANPEEVNDDDASEAEGS